VRAPPAQHAEIEGLLRELDSPARQVLLEATIAEVTLNDRLDIGTRWFFENGNFDFRFSDQAGAVAGNDTGFTAVFGTGSADVALSALAAVTDVKIISAPTLMVIDNKEGVLQIGDQVPIVTSQSQDQTANAPILTQVEYRDTGIILRVRPRIGAGGRVTLEISQEVSDVAETETSGIDSPTIRQRRVQTSVALIDGQTLALGGLVQESDRMTRSEVPGLGRVPVVGNLFRNKDSRRGRTELLILIRPRVILSEGDANSATAYWRTKLSGANSTLETGLGRPRHSVSDVIE
jgi:general secretion pathway protein D